MNNLAQDGDGRPIFPCNSSSQGVFSPEELSRIRQMFDAARQACRVSGNGDNADALGRAVIRLYRNGVRNPSVAANMLQKAFRRA